MARHAICTCMVAGLVCSLTLKYAMLHPALALLPDRAGRDQSMVQGRASLATRMLPWRTSSSRGGSLGAGRRGRRRGRRRGERESMEHARRLTLTHRAALFQWCRILHHILSAHDSFLPQEVKSGLEQTQHTTQNVVQSLCFDTPTSCSSLVTSASLPLLRSCSWYFCTSTHPDKRSKAV